MTSDFLTPAQAAKLWPRPRTHFSAVVRAIVDGTKSKVHPDRRIKLRAVRDTQGWRTTSAWVDEFFAAITADRGGVAPRVSVEDRAQRARERLAASGFWK